MINSNKIFATIVAVMLAIIAVYYVDISDGVVENFINGGVAKAVSNESHPMAHEVHHGAPKSHPVQVFRNAAIPRLSRMSSMGLKAAVPDATEVPEHYTPQNCREQVVESFDDVDNVESSADSSLMKAVMGSSNQMTLTTKKGRLHAHGDFFRGDLVPCQSETAQGWFKSSLINTNNLNAGAMSMMTDVNPESTTAHVQMAKSNDGHIGRPTAVTSLYDDISMH